MSCVVVPRHPDMIFCMNLMSCPCESCGCWPQIKWFLCVCEGFAHSLPCTQGIPNRISRQTLCVKVSQQFSGKSGSACLVREIYSKQPNETRSRLWQQLRCWTYDVHVCTNTQLGSSSAVQEDMTIMGWKVFTRAIPSLPGVWGQLPVWEHLLLVDGRVATVQTAWSCSKLDR